MKPKKKAPQRFAIYLRCSTDDQSYGDFTTIDTQRQLNQERVAELGGTVVAEYADEGKTGTNLSRKDWKRMLADAGGKRFDAVVVTYMSRLARGEVYHVAEYLLKEEKVKVELVKEKFSPDMVGQMHKQMTIMMDGQYCRQVSDWTRTKQGQMVKQGYHTGGVPTYGYRSETVPGMQPTTLPGGKVKPAPKRIVPDECRAPIVRRAFELYAESHNMGAALRYLREQEPDLTWTIDRVSRMLANDRYRGVARFGDNVNPEAHEPIIELELWDTVQAALTAKRTLADDPRAFGLNIPERKDTLPYYLRGKVFCEHCGCRMTPASHHGNSTRVGYYQCTRGCTAGAACPVKRINANTLHELVLKEIERAAKHPTRMTGMVREAMKAIPSQTEEAAELARVQRNIREAEKKIARFVGAIREGKGGAIDVLTSEIERQREHQKQLEEKASELEHRLSQQPVRPDTAGLCDLWGTLTDGWSDMTEEERTQFLGLIVDSVSLEEKNKGTLRLLLCSPETLERPLDRLEFQPYMGAGTSRISIFVAEVSPSASSVCKQPLDVLTSIALPHGASGRLHRALVLLSS